MQLWSMCSHKPACRQIMKIKDYAYATDDRLTNTNTVQAEVSNIEQGKIVATFKLTLAGNNNLQRPYILYQAFEPRRWIKSPQIWDAKVQDAEQFAFFLMNYKSIENSWTGEVVMMLTVDVGEPLLDKMKLILNKGLTHIYHISALRLHGIIFISTYEKRIDFSEEQRPLGLPDNELFQYDKKKMEIYIDRVPTNPPIPDDEYDIVLNQTIETLLYPFNEPWQTVTIKIRDRQLKQLFDIPMFYGLLFKRTDDEFIFVAHNRYISGAQTRFNVNSINGIENALARLNQQLTAERRLLEEANFKVQWIKVLRDEGEEKARQMISVDGSTEQTIFRSDGNLDHLLTRYESSKTNRTRQIFTIYIKDYKTEGEDIELRIIELEKQRDRMYYPQDLKAELYSRGKDLTARGPDKKKKRMMNMFKLSFQ